MLNTNLTDDKLYELFVESLNEVREEAQSNRPSATQLIENIVYNFLTICEKTGKLPTFDEMSVVKALKELSRRY